MRKIRMRNNDLKQKQELQEARYQPPKDRRFETSKLLAVYLFVLLNAIVVFSMVSMWHFGDLSYLGVLISDIAAQVVIYAIYCVKAYKGKKAEEDNKLERDKMLCDIEPTAEDDVDADIIASRVVMTDE